VKVEQKINNGRNFAERLKPSLPSWQNR